MADGKRDREHDNDTLPPSSKRQQIGNLRRVTLEDEEEPIPAEIAIATPPARPIPKRRAEPFGIRRVRGNQKKPAADSTVGRGETPAQPASDIPASPTGTNTPQPTPNDRNSPPPPTPTPLALPKATAKPLLAWEIRGKETHINLQDPPTSYPSPGQRYESISTNPPAWGPDPNKNPTSTLKGTPSEHAAWLASSSKWHPSQRLDTNWKGTKMLGFGGFAMVGLWERGGTMKPRRMVVKQQAKSLDKLEEEAGFLRLIGGTGSSHVVRLFRGVFRDRGQGTVAGFDEMGISVGRMYLEYCEGGDFGGFVMGMYRKFSARNPMPERLIWQVFKCLALGLAVIENGNELGEGAESWKDVHDILHRDIKPANILVGNNDEDHLQIPIFKISDFGLAMEARKIQDKDYVSRYARRGTRSFWAPEVKMTHESYEEIARERKLTNALDVWALGKTMYYLICRGRDIPPETFYANIRPQTWAAPTLTMGKDLLNAPYSSALRRLVLHCLAFDYALRPKPRELVKYIDEALAASAAVPMDTEYWPSSYDEPGDLDPSWFGEVKAAGPPELGAPPPTPANIFPFQFRPQELVQSIIDGLWKIALG